MRFILLTLIVLNVFTGSEVYAQTKIGLVYDAEKRPIQQSFDPFTYTAKNKVNVIISKTRFSPGYYYNKEHKKFTGWIAQEKNKILYKTTEDGIYDTRKIDEVESYVVGVDSFFSISNYMKSENLKIKPVFCHFVGRVGKVTYVNFRDSYIYETSVGRSPMLAKHDTAQIWDEFFEGGLKASKNKENFKQLALKYFGEIPELRKEIEAGNYSLSDVYLLVKVSGFYYKLEHHLPIYVDPYWRITYSKERAKYYALIESKKDSVWTLNFYHEGKLMYQTKYSSFMPTTKILTNSYHNNGMVKSQISFEENDIRKFQIFNTEGNYITQYLLTEKEIEYSEKKEYVTEYHYLADIKGFSLIDVNQDVKQSVVNEIDGVKYFQTYKLDRLLESYYISNEQKTYQVVRSDYQINLKPLTNKIRKYRKYKMDTDSNFNTSKDSQLWNFKTPISLDAKGIIMVKFTMDESGKVVDYKILNTLQSDYNQYLDLFLNKKVLNKFSFKAYKVNNKKVRFEITVPFKFKIIDYVPKKGSPNHDPNMYGSPSVPHYSVPVGGY